MTPPTTDIRAAAQQALEALLIVRNNSSVSMHQLALISPAIDALRTALAAAVAEERERCAKLCDEAKPQGGRMWTDEQAACFDCLTHVADAIRAAPAAPPQREPYDQTALGLCNACGWKAVGPDGCLNCAPQREPQWVPVAERLPPSGQTVLACYTNRAGRLRRIRAEWIAAKSVESSSEHSDIGVYDEDTDTFYDPEGWYERIDNWGDYSAVGVCEGDVTHWMPLPDAPASAPKDAG